MAIKKFELYLFLWKSGDELSGCIDDKKYEGYVLEETVDRLKALVVISKGLNFGGPRADGDDLLGNVPSSRNSRPVGMVHAFEVT